MSERKNWTQQEDKVLKFLREQRDQKKWSAIAKMMRTEFNLGQRTGKQCRQRYHNHLDSKINTAEWTDEQNKVLYQMHFQYGNKWSIIAQKLVGRTDNCIKNHFYSTLRKSIRRINKLISSNFKKNHKEIQTKILYKIIQFADSKFKTTSKVDEQTAQFCATIKNRLFKLEDVKQQMTQEQLQSAQQLIQDISKFIATNKRLRKQHFEFQNEYLHPKSCLYLKKTNSSASNRSQQDASSQYSSSFASYSSQYQSDCSEQNQQCKPKARTRAKSQFKQNDSDDGILNKSVSKSCKSNIQQINHMMQTMQIGHIQNCKQTQSVIQRKSFQKLWNQNQFQKQSDLDIQDQIQSLNIKNYEQDEMDIEGDNWNYANNENFFLNKQQQNCAFFQDFNFQIKISSPKVSSDSNKSFSDNFFE